VVELPHDQNSISLNFSAFDLRHPENRMYRYRLNGWSDAWRQNNSGDLTAHFAGLKPGKYLFELQTTYKGWPWILENAVIFITISNPPFYLSQTFRALIALIAAFSLLSVVFLLFRNFKIRKEALISYLEKEANQAKLNFLKSQMNPHSYFNTLNAINSFILENDIRSANKYLTTFSRLMREILENSEKDFISVEKECEALEKFLRMQQLRFPELFEYSIKKDATVVDMLIPPMILHPIVENSTEYAFPDTKQKGIIQISFEKNNGILICRVIDNGIGIKKSEEIKEKNNRKSTALINIARRIEILQQIYNIRIELKITSAFPENEANPGTMVLLKLPDFRHQSENVIQHKRPK
jgi:signal transduction histidine kinase